MLFFGASMSLLWIYMQCVWITGGHSKDNEFTVVGSRSNLIFWSLLELSTAKSSCISTLQFVTASPLLEIELCPLLTSLSETYI